MKVSCTYIISVYLKIFTNSMLLRTSILSTIIRVPFFLSESIYVIRLDFILWQGRRGGEGKRKRWLWSSVDGSNKLSSYNLIVGRGLSTAQEWRWQKMMPKFTSISVVETCGSDVLLTSFRNRSQREKNS